MFAIIMECVDAQQDVPVQERPALMLIIIPQGYILLMYSAFSPKWLLVLSQVWTMSARMPAVSIKRSPAKE